MWSTQVERELVAVLAQQPARAQRVADVVEVEHVRGDDRDDALAQPVRVAQPLERLVGELGADLRVVAVAGFA